VDREASFATGEKKDEVPDPVGNFDKASEMKQTK
jgi:hypothetical protein